MKTVITGGAGFIGSHLAKRLLEEGREVVVVDDFSRGKRQNLADLIHETQRLHIIQVDLCDYQRAYHALEGADVVYHLAARVGSLEYLHSSELAELEALQAIMMIDTNVCRACVRHKIKKAIYTSSVAVYPIHTQHQPGVVLSENDFPLNPHLWSSIFINPEGGYGWAKLLGEIQLSWMKETSIGIARLFNIYGENEPLDERAHVVPALLRKAVLYPREEFVVWGDGSQSRDLLYVSDCVDALVRLEKILSEPARGRELLTVNISSGKTVTIREVAEKIAEISGKGMKPVYDTKRPVGPLSRTADISQTMRLLNWQPRVSLEEGLRRTYAWAQKVIRRGKTGNG